MLQLDWYPKVKGRSSKGGIEADSYSSPSEPTHPESIEEECIVPIASRGGACMTCAAASTPAALG
jgi:hypothetical protein